MRADPPTEKALLEILDRFCSAFTARDASGVIELFAPDADVVMVTSEEALLRGPAEIAAFPRLLAALAGRRRTVGTTSRSRRSLRRATSCTPFIREVVIVAARV